jgi:hypothetical protein
LKKEHSKRISEKKQRYQKRDNDRPTASTEPVERAEAKPEARREKREDEPRRNDGPRTEQRNAQPHEERRPPREDSGPSVTGFGDSTPAFLRPKK